MRIRRDLLVALMAAWAAAACDSQPPVILDGGAVDGRLSGTVVKGVLSGATVTVRVVNPDGATGVEAGAGLTDAAGAFDVTLGSADGPLLVRAEGGRYVEEATGETVGLDVPLEAYVPFDVGQTLEGVQVNPVTTLVAAYTRWRVGALGEGFELAHAQAKRVVEDHFGEVDWGTTRPEDVTATTSVALTSSTIAGVLLAGLSYEGRLQSEALGLPGSTLNAAVLTGLLARDLEADGFFDGRGEGGARLSAQGYDVSGDTLRRELAVAIVRFLESDRNATRLGRQDVRALVDFIATDGPAPGVEAVPGRDLFRTPSSGADLDPPELVFELPPEHASARDRLDVRVRATDADSSIAALGFVAPEGLEARDPVGLGTPTAVIEAELNAGAFPDGPVTLVAYATDAAGYRVEASREIYVANGAPTLIVSAPKPGATVSGTIRVAATAEPNPDTQGTVVRLEVITPEGLTDTLPAAARLAADWDTTLAPEGGYTLQLEAEDAFGSLATVQVPVLVDNRPAPVITGRVVVAGRPVENPRLLLRALNERTASEPEGRVIGTAEGDATGAFSLTVDDEAYAGPVRLVATRTDAADRQTRYRDVLAGTDVVLATGDTLSVFLPDVRKGPSEEWTSIVVTPWTTIADALAGYYLIRELDPLAPVEAAGRAEEMIAGHFHRADPFALLYDAPADLTAGPVTLAAAYPGLADLGLTQMAVTYSEEAQVPPGTAITTLTMTQLLAKDLRDGVFNGYDTGSRLQVAGKGLHENITRAYLALQVNLFVAGDLNRSELTPEALKADGFYEDIAMDAREIYPPGDPPPFDSTPPVITWTSPAAEDTDAGAAPVSIDLAAQDPIADASGLAEFYLLAPPTLEGLDNDSTLERIRLSVDNTVPPNDGYYVKVSAWARDVVGLDATSSRRFTRPAPTATIDHVTRQPSGTEVSGPVAGAFRIAASATRGFATTSFVLVTPAAADAAAVGPDQAGTSSDLSLLVDVDPSGGKLSDGPHTFEVLHEAIDGRSASDSVTVTVDNTAPTVSATLTSPSTSIGADRWLKTSGLDGQGVAIADATFAYQVQDATAGLARIELVDQGRVLASATPGACRATGCTGTLQADLVEGDYVLLVRAVDGAGNTASSAPVSVRVDTSPPAFTTGPTFDSPRRVPDGAAFWLPRTGSDAGGAYGEAVVGFEVQDGPSGVAEVVLTASGTLVAGTPVTREATQSFGGCVSQACTGQLSLNLREGSYQLSVEVRDQAGNVTTSAPWTVRVDTTDPRLQATLTNSNTVGGIDWVGRDGIASTGTPWFQYVAQDNLAGITGVRVVATASSVGSDATVGDTYSGDCVSTACAVSLWITLQEGRYDVYLDATDKAGNRAESQHWTVYVDAHEPVAVSTTTSSFLDPRDLDFVRTGTGYEYVPRSASANVFQADAADPLAEWYKFEHRFSGTTEADAAADRGNLPLFHIRATDQVGDPNTAPGDLEVQYRYYSSDSTASWTLERDWTNAPAALNGSARPNEYFVVASQEMLSPALAQDGRYHRIVFRVRDRARNMGSFTFTFRLHLLPAPVAVSVDTSYASSTTAQTESLYAHTFRDGNVGCLFRDCGYQDLDYARAYRVAHAVIHQPHTGYVALVNVALGPSVHLDRTTRQRPLQTGTVTHPCTVAARYPTSTGSEGTCTILGPPSPTADNPPCLDQWGHPDRRVVWKNTEPANDPYAGCREDSPTPRLSFQGEHYLRDDGGDLVNAGRAIPVDAVVLNRSTGTVVAASSTVGTVRTYRLPAGTYDLYFRIAIQTALNPAWTAPTRTALGSGGGFHAYGVVLQDQQRWAYDNPGSYRALTWHNVDGNIYATCSPTITGTCTGWTTRKERVVKYEERLVWYGESGTATDSGSSIAVNVTNATTTIPTQRDPLTATSVNETDGSERYVVYHQTTESGL